MLNITPKRVNFISIQNAHAIGCDAYKQSRIRTGYEYVVAKRTGTMFAQAAKQDGKVIKLTDNSMQIQYKDGSTAGFEIGRVYGAYSGMTLPHMLKAHVKEGASFKAGDILYYNTNFFEPDVLDPKQVIWKKAMLCRVALLESKQTIEDASSISKSLAEKLTTKVTKVKEVVLTFDQTVSKIAEVGSIVEPETILCIIEDAVTSDLKIFDQESLDTLRLLSNQSPRAKVKGVLERIEVYYHGDKEEMSESIRKLTDQSDKEMIKRRKDAGKSAYNGSVNDDMRIKGEPLQINNVAIKFYITSDVTAVIGDKAVFANQMKTVISEVMESDYITESGLQVDAVFGAKSIDARIVESPYIIGTTNTLLGVIADRAVSIYKGK